MCPNFKNRLTNQVVAYDQRQSKLEIAQVDAVHWHRTKNDKNWNVSDIVSRDRRTKAHDPDFSYVRHRVPCIQEDGAKFSGHPANPRRGNAVKALFYKNQKPIILGPVESKFEPPVCRPDPYTYRCKRNQYRPLTQDEDKDFVTDFPDLKKPSCENWQHGPCQGNSSDDGKEPCLGRDWWQVYDYCVQGDEDPSCEKCTDIDFCKRCKNTWIKAYSANTMSCSAPNRRWELHQYDGSALRFENEDGPSEVYSEGKGHVQLQGATSEDTPKGHWTHYPNGNFEIQSETSSMKDNLPIGARIKVFSHEDTGLIAAEMIWFDAGNPYVRIMKNGEIMIGTPAKITIESTASEVLIKAATKITLDSPLTHNTADVQTDGTCTHVGCVCPCCGGN